MSYDDAPLPELPSDPPEEKSIYCNICNEELFEGDEFSEYEDFTYAHVKCEIDQ